MDGCRRLDEREHDGKIGKKQGKGAKGFDVTGAIGEPLVDCFVLSCSSLSRGNISPEINRNRCEDNQVKSSPLI